MLTLLKAQTSQGCGYTSHDSHTGPLYVYHHLYLILFGKIINLLENNEVFVFEIKRIARSQRGKHYSCVTLMYYSHHQQGHYITR